MRRSLSLLGSLRPLAARALVLALLGLGLIACGDDVETSSAAAEGAAASTGSGVSGGLQPPVLLEVTAFALSLKITWEAPSPCDFIEGERRTAGAEFEASFEALGSDTVYVDADATTDQTYTYRLRCKIGDKLSDYSNEKTGNPMKF